MTSRCWIAGLAAAPITLALFAGAAPAQSLYRPGMVADEVDLRGPLDPPQQPADEGTWLVEEDVRLHHFAEGEGRNVLFIHGGPGFPPPMALPGLSLLKDGFQVHYYHQRGCGKSTRLVDRFESKNYYANMMALDRDLGLAVQIADVERIRRILGEERLILVAHSFGAVFACLYAAEFPERVEKLVLLSPADSLFMPKDGGGLFGEIAKRLPEERQQEFAAWQKDYFDFGGIFGRNEKELARLSARFAEYYSAASREPAAAMDVEQIGGWLPFAVYFSMGMKYDYRPLLGKITAPALVVHGAKDLQPESVARQYVDAIPGARLAVIEDCGHFALRDRPADFARVAGEFLGKPAPPQDK